jgi:membrane protein
VTTQSSPYVRRPDANAHGRDADRPSAIPKRGWRDILLRVWENIDRDNVLIIAAGMAFFAFLAIPPGLTALVSLYGLLADPVDIEDQLTNLLGVLPPDAIRLVSHQLVAIAQNSSSTLSVSFVVSLVVALWSARSGTSTLITALNIAYKESEKRGIIEFNLVALALTLCAALVSAVSLVLVAVLPAVLDFIPFPGVATTVARLARWPILVILMMTAMASVYRLAPSRSYAKWRWVSWGAAAGAALWLAGSLLFSFYVEALAPYNRLYGSLGAVVVLMTWLYLSCIAILLGAELDAEIEHQTARDSTGDPEKPLGQRGAVMADTVGGER